MTFRLKGRASNQGFDCEITISYSTETNRVSFISERVTTSRVYRYTRDVSGRVQASKKVSAPLRVLLIPPEKSLLQYAFGCGIPDWQFVSLNPRAMGEPVLGHQTEARVRLNKDGTNISSYLYDLFTADPGAYNGLLETLQLVLPYAREFRPEVVKGELEQRVFLNLQESTFQLPGWLLSTGTLRILALLALLRHPKAPALIFIEEIENGLDPRTIGILVNEISRCVRSGRTQIIATTHSPYLLDQLLLEHIITVDRDASGQPVFRRPSNSEELQKWAESFSLGEMYKKGLLRGSE